MIFVLIILLAALAVAAYKLFDRDIFSPPVALTAIFALCAASTLYNYNRWNMNEFHLNTCLLIIWGVVVFLAVSWLIYHWLKPRFSVALWPVRGAEDGAVSMDRVKLLLVVVADLIVLYFFFRQVVRIAEAGGYTSGEGYQKLMSVFRATYSYNTLSAEEGLPFWINQALKLMTAFAYAYLYLFVNNFMQHGFRWKDLWLMTPVALYAVQSLMSAGRLNLLRLAAAALMMAYFLWHRRHGWRRMNSARVLLICAAAFAAVMVLFFLLKDVVGRVTDKDFLYYTTVFTGGPIRLFDLYLKDPVAPSAVFGKETFWSLHQFLAKYGIAGEAYIRHLEFRYVNGYNVGNVYTAFRRYYQDFGFIGLTVFQALNALLFSGFYVALKSKHRGRLADVALFFYSFIAYALFILPIDDQIFSAFINVSSATLLVALLVAWWFLFVFQWEDIPLFRVSPPKGSARAPASATKDHRTGGLTRP